VRGCAPYYFADRQRGSAQAHLNPPQSSSDYSSGLVQSLSTSQPKEELMLSKRQAQLFAVALVLVSGTPAMALNPQPLLPGRSPSFTAAPDRSLGAHRFNSSIPRCHSVQVGDPRKQPPMLVCN
jgi:hypothetical protein